jgi:eukaryotic-like serine/threonine-protein kinase
MPLAAGTRLGPREILVPIGTGGMDEVYRAHDLRRGRDVAVKISAERFNDRFSREVRAVAALNHSNICQLYNVGPNCLVMELVEGPTLAERIMQGGRQIAGLRQSPVPLEEAIAIAKQTAKAVEATTPYLAFGRLSRRLSGAGTSGVAVIHEEPDAMETI